MRRNLLICAATLCFLLGILRFSAAEQSCNPEHDRLLELDTADLLESAESGDWQAQLRLAHLYENNIPVLIDLKAAELWYRQAANQQHPDAKYALACFLARGIEFARKVEAREILEEMLAAHPTYVPAKVTYAKFLDLGFGGRRIEDMAKRIIENVTSSYDSRNNNDNSSYSPGGNRPNERITEVAYILFDFHCGPSGARLAGTLGVKLPQFEQPLNPQLEGNTGLPP